MKFSFKRTMPGDDALIKEVINLADANKKTLGFLPASVIEKRCHNGSCFVCTYNNKLIGYILFSHLKRTHIIKILHFCIEKNNRRSGIATVLFRKFIQSMHDAFCIELSCRSDYGISQFWEQLGFKIVNAREGRAITELSVLHLYRYSLQKNLLDHIEDVDTRPKVLLDSSIIFDFDFPLIDFTEKNSILLYSNDVVFCIAPVIFDDMNRQQDSITKRESLSKVKQFKTISSSIKHFNTIYSSLKNEFPQIKDSDLKQLTCAVSNNVKCFVTNDRQLLSLVNQFADNYGVMIYSPSEFYINIDFILNREILHTEILPSTYGKLIDIKLEENDLCNTFLNTAKGEKKYEFLSKFKNNKKNSFLKSIVVAEKNIGFIYYTISDKIMTVYLLRIIKSRKNTTFITSSFILSELIQIATRSGLTLIQLNDEYAHPQLQIAAKELGFIDNKKLSFHFVGNRHEYLPTAKRVIPSDFFSKMQQYFGQQSASDDFYSQVAFERTVFPAKFLDLLIPTYIVPIKALWAKDLLTPEIIGQNSFFLSPTGNVLMHDINVYYSGTKTRISAPGRILWYVTGSTSRDTYVKWAKHIIATSYLDEVYRGTKEEIFKKFWKIGVYKWADIGNIAGNVCTAMLFSRTEIFANKVPYVMVSDAIYRLMGKGFTPISATPISNDVFFEIYQQGHKNVYA